MKETLAQIEANIAALTKELSDLEAQRSQRRPVAELVRTGDLDTLMGEQRQLNQRIAELGILIPRERIKYEQAMSDWYQNQKAELQIRMQQAWEKEESAREAVNAAQAALKEATAARVAATSAFIECETVQHRSTDAIRKHEAEIAQRMQLL